MTRPGALRAGLTITGLTLLAAPAAAEATLVGLSAKTTTPSECFAPQQSYASTSCQIYAGQRLEIVAVASRDDGSVRLMPQPFTLLALEASGAAPVTSFTLFDDSHVDDAPLVTPTANTDYQLRFNGNADMPPATSATMAVSVGARLTVPRGAGSGRWDSVRVPVILGLARRALRGRIELRRCHRAQETSASSCARPSSHTVVATRRAVRSRRAAFRVAAPPRSLRRYEVAFNPASPRFATTRRAFSVLRGFDGVTSYRPSPRSSPFGDR
jgi:hypothetical protein